MSQFFQLRKIARPLLSCYFFCHVRNVTKKVMHTVAMKRTKYAATIATSISDDQLVSVIKRI